MADRAGHLGWAGGGHQGGFRWQQVQVLRQVWHDLLHDARTDDTMDADIVAEPTQYRACEVCFNQDP